ncbi:Cupin domain-containing protein [Cyclobacterium xiamenense]|uniref:Cupin domain-containing protein n=1 Tax=Cyclobacterium xiamenense TaxID=1297121 RepID=A0A1H6T134_9BACT|nr:cupin domain-containing protein [Cyclobacterium xiamenense]SEI73803.1 Cupin domain-containing protein [Cyclobacterium xiamenense]
MKLLFSLAFLLALTQSHAQQEIPHPSSAFEFTMLPAAVHTHGEERQLMDWPTKTLENFRVQHRVLTASEPLQLNEDREMLLIVTAGALQFQTGEKAETLGERSVAWLPRQTEVLLSPQDAQVSLYLIAWDVDPASRETEPEGWEPRIFQYASMDYQETAKGGRRSVMRAATETLQELEMHITTLKEGEKSHDPHVHADEEIILVLQGEVSEHIKGTEYRLGPESLVFLSALDPHGIRNVGTGECEYYAIRWITAKTGSGQF